MQSFTEKKKELPSRLIGYGITQAKTIESSITGPFEITNYELRETREENCLVLLLLISGMQELSRYSVTLNQSLVLTIDPRKLSSSIQASDNPLSRSVV